MKLGLFILTFIAFGLQSNAQMDNDIEVTIECDSSTYSSCRNVTISGKLINKADHIKHVFPELIESSVLALTVYNDKGERIPTVPPGVPKSEPFIKIKPSDTLELSYDLNMFSPDLPKGHYFVKMNQFASNKIHFEIK